MWRHHCGLSRQCYWISYLFFMGLGSNMASLGLKLYVLKSWRDSWLRIDREIKVYCGVKPCIHKLGLNHSVFSWLHEINLKNWLKIYSIVWLTRFLPLSGAGRGSCPRATGAASRRRCVGKQQQQQQHQKEQHQQQDANGCRWPRGFKAKIFLQVFLRFCISSLSLSGERLDYDGNCFVQTSFCSISFFFLSPWLKSCSGYFWTTDEKKTLPFFSLKKFRVLWNES